MIKKQTLWFERGSCCWNVAHKLPKASILNFTWHIHWLVWTPCLMHRCVCIWRYILHNYNYKLTFSKPLYTTFRMYSSGLWPLKILMFALLVTREIATYSWYWYQNFEGAPPGPGMPFLDSDTCARGRGVIYFCQGFLPCMMPSTDGWRDGWMDGRVTWWKKLHEKRPQRPLLYVIVHIHAISLGQKKWQRTKVGLKKTLLSMSWGSIHPWGSGFFSFWGRMRV
jgi:hypothetical protein